MTAQQVEERTHMALDDDLRPLHQLSRVGEERYQAFLEEKADELLFKHEHPLKWLLQKIREWIDGYFSS